MSENDFEKFCKANMDDVINSILKYNKKKSLIDIKYVLSELKDYLIQKHGFEEVSYTSFDIPNNGPIIHTKLDGISDINKYLSIKNIEKIEKHNQLVINKILDKLN